MLEPWRRAKRPDDMTGRRFAPGVSLGMMMIALTACSGGSNKSATTPKTGANTAVSTSIPTSTVTSHPSSSTTVLAATEPCKATQLSVTLGSDGAALGHRPQDFILRNASERTCTLQGAVRVRQYDVHAEPGTRRLGRGGCLYVPCGSRTPRPAHVGCVCVVCDTGKRQSGRCGELRRTVPDADAYRVRHSQRRWHTPITEGSRRMRLRRGHRLEHRGWTSPTTVLTPAITADRHSSSTRGLVTGPSCPSAMRRRRTRSSPLRSPLGQRRWQEPSRTNKQRCRPGLHSALADRGP